MDSAVKTLRFDDCELSVASREFYRAGELVSVEPRVFDLLVFLIEQRHRAVDKSEIQNTVWKGAIVSETALTRAIMKARRIVGDSAETQSVIRTVHGHGYQFIADLDADQVDNEEEPDTESPTLASPRVVAAIIAVLLLAFVMYLWPSPEPPQGVRLAVMPVENATSDSEYDWTKLGLMGFATDLLSQARTLTVIPSSDVMKFAEMPGDSKGLEDLRDLYGASHMLSSTLEVQAGVLRLSYVLTLPSGEIEHGTTVGAEPAALMRDMVRTVSASLGEKRRPISEPAVLSDDLFINEAYSRGLGLVLEGRCPEALGLFKVITASQLSISRADYELANCARIMGHWQEAEAGFERVIEGLPVEPSSTLRALGLNGLGTVYIRTGRSDAARETYEKALLEAKSAGDYRLQGMILNSLAIAAKNRREHDAARDLLARARLAYSDAGQAIPPGQVPAALANVDMAEGMWDAAEGHLQEALASFRTLGDRRNEAKMLNNFGYLRRQQGRWDEAEPLHMQSLEIRREIRDVVGQGRILGMLSSLYVADGRMDEARDAAQEAYRIASEANDKLFMATGLAHIANVARRSGDLEDARDAYLDSQRIFLEIDDHSRAAQTSLRLAQMEAEAGYFDEASRTINEVMEMTLREGLPEPTIEAMEYAGDVARLQQDSEGAIASYRRALNHMRETGFTTQEFVVAYKLAEELLDSSEVEAAEPLIGFVIERGDPRWGLQLRARHAFITGDPARAVELQEAARIEAEDEWSDQAEAELVRYKEEAGNAQID